MFKKRKLSVIPPDIQTRIRGHRMQRLIMVYCRYFIYKLLRHEKYITGLASLLWDIGEQHRSRSEAIESFILALYWFNPGILVPI